MAVWVWPAWDWARLPPRRRRPPAHIPGARGTTLGVDPAAHLIPRVHPIGTGMSATRGTASIGVRAMFLRLFGTERILHPIIVVPCCRALSSIPGVAAVRSAGVAITARLRTRMRTSVCSTWLPTTWEGCDVRAWLPLPTRGAGSDGRRRGEAAGSPG